MRPGASTHDTHPTSLVLAMLMTDAPPTDWPEGRCAASVRYDDGVCMKRAAIGNLCRFHHVTAMHRADRQLTSMTSAMSGGWTR